MTDLSDAANWIELVQNSAKNIFNTVMELTVIKARDFLSN